MTTTESSVSSSSRRRRNLKTAGAAALAGAVILGSSMAYFTDRLDTSASATAGTVDISITENWQDVANFNPGDQTDLSYVISNSGNKSVDVRETIVVKSNVAMDASTQAEFEIYKASDVEQAANGSYAPKSGAQPITTGADRIVSADNMSIKYVIDEYVLNGTGANAETEDGVNTTENTSEYVLVFKAASDNDFQGSEITVDLLAEAKQHRNTDENTWVTVATESVTLGSEAVGAVPER